MLNLKISTQEQFNSLPDVLTIKLLSGYYISGRVIDSKTKKPLCGIIVLPKVVKSIIDVGIWNSQFEDSFNRYDPFAEMATFTDEIGYFKVGPLPEGTCELQIGFDLEKKIKLSIKNKNINNYTINLNPSKPGVALKGRAFLLDTKHPLDKTKIKIKVLDNSHSEAHSLWEPIVMSVTTDSKGYFTLFPVRKEMYSFESEYKGYTASTPMSVKSKNPILNLIYKKEE